MFKKGDFVSIKDGVSLENGEQTKSWAGQVVEKISDPLTYIIKLDAPTLDALSDDYVHNCIKKGEYSERYIIEEKGLELSQRRDTEITYEIALEKLTARKKAFKEKEGVEFSDKEQLDQYLLDYNQKIMYPSMNNSSITNDYKDIGRNQKISVKYPDGKVIEDVKFKKVQKDLIAGKCELV